MKREIEAALDRSWHVLECVCPTGNVIKGIASREYHKENSETPFSMFTASQILWAMTSSKNFPKTHYLVIELLAKINELLNKDIISKHDRVLSKSFWLLALTCAGQPIQSEPYRNLFQNLIDTQRETGAWGTCSKDDDNLRATALTVIAFCECLKRIGSTSNTPAYNLNGKLQCAVRYMISNQKKDGYYLRSVKSINPEEKVTFQPGIEVTAWVTYAMVKCLTIVEFSNEEEAKIKRAIQTSVKWLMSQKISEVATKTEIEEEFYIKEDIEMTHEYGAGSLDILILALVEYRHSKIYIYTKEIDSYINKAITRLLEDESNGSWYDKNSGGYTKVWKTAYAVKCLSVFCEYLNEEIEFRKKLIRKTILFIHALAHKSIRVLFSIPMIILYFIAGFVLLFLKINIESPIIGIISLILGAIGIIISIYYGKKGNS